LTPRRRGRAGIAALALALAAALLWWGWPRPHRVLDCQGGLGRCEVRELDARLVDCEPWRPDTCRRTREGLRDVSYVADLVTQVTSPFTGERFFVEVAPVELDRPWDLELLPDGSLLVTEKPGRIVRVAGGVATEVGRLEPLVVGESGLLGLAVDPDFGTTARVFVYYTRAWDPATPAGVRPDRRLLNRISSLRLREGRLAEEVVLLDDIPGAPHHSGGRLAIGPDRRLYATTGDAVAPHRAQDVSFLGGKVLRLELDGRVPEDNPFPGSPVFSRGHRNPQGLAWSASGELFACEHGPWRYDEINRVRAGGNHGWGAYSCRQKQPGIPETGLVTFPLVCFDTWTAAPSGMAFVADEASPWNGSLFVAMLRGRHLHRFRFDGDRVSLDEIFFVSGAPAGHPGGGPAGDSGSGGLDLRIRDVEYHDGSLYVIGDAFGLAKITPRF